MNKVQKIDLVFVVFVFLFLSIPNIYINQEKISIKENRTLSAYKHLFTNGKINTNYGTDFEAFYGDHFFTRNILLNLHAKISKFCPQNTLGNSNVFVGTDGWLFNRLDNAYSNYVNTSFFSITELNKILNYLESIDSWCKKNKKQFIFFIAPDKNKIYGEYFPKQIKKINPDTNSKTFQLINFLNKNSEVKIIYPYNALINEKQKGNLLYYKNDTHWNKLGAYIGYKELCKELKIEPYKILHYEDTFNEQGDLNAMLSYTLQSDSKTVYKIPIVQKNYSIKTINDSVEHEILTKNNSDSNKLNAVFFRDSFSSNLIPYISNTFSKVQYNNRYEIFERDFKSMQDSNIIVLEVVERRVCKIIDLPLPAFITEEN